MKRPTLTITSCTKLMHFYSERNVINFSSFHRVVQHAILCPTPAYQTATVKAPAGAPDASARCVSWLAVCKLH